MFQLDKHDVAFSNLNLRKENHGDEKVPAADLTFDFTAANTVLALIDPALRAAHQAVPGQIPVPQGRRAAAGGLTTSRLGACR